MSETLFQQQLREMYACREARNWVGDRHAGKAWRECERGDWMLWLAGKARVDRKLIVLAACACARTALKFVPEGEARPLAAIETAERWARGDASVGPDDVRTAANAASNAATSNAAYAGYAADAAAYAAYAANAANAANLAADAAYAANAAAYAADAATNAASADAASADAASAYAAGTSQTARLTGLKVCSRLVRQHIPFPVLKAAYASRKK